MKEASRKARILIVDDSSINIRMLGETLLPDYEISVTTNGPEAIELANADHSPDLILLDIMMPGMDGYEVCERLKADSQTRNIPVIFITARTEEAEETKGFELGAVDYITKPFSPAVVRARVETHLALKRYRDRIEESNTLLKQEIAERKRSEAALKENEEYLRTIMATIQTGVVIIDPKTRKIIDANPWASKIIGYGPEDLIGLECVDFKKPGGTETFQMPNFCKKVDGDDCVLETSKKETIHVRRSSASAMIKDHEYYIHSYLDITDIKQLMKKQEVNIDLAKNLLTLVNGVHPDYIELGGGLTMYVDGVSLPCYAEGGDHFFVRTYPHERDGKATKTVISLKDQSGHEVSCVLRSIITDLIHNALLNRKSDSLEETVSRLNQEIFHSGAFAPEDFFTAINAEIDHETLRLRFVSAGHPPFLLIRGDDVREFPESGGAGMNLPVALAPNIPFTFGETQLQKGDRLILYTDGLTEMPLRNRNRVLTIGELKETVRQALNRHSGQGRIHVPVSFIMEDILAKIAEFSGEEVVPFGKNGQKNTSGDDITILGIEIEQTDYEEMCRNPGNTHEMTAYIETVFEKIAGEWERRGYSAAGERLHMVIEESMLNAWKHGNKKDPDKSVTVRWRFGNELHIGVIDEGEGFDIDRVPDPTLAENLTRPSGRGLFIIKHYADKVRRNPGSKHLVMSFKKDADSNTKIYSNQKKRFMNLWGNE